MAITGVDAIRMLNEGGFPLRTKKELDELKFGEYSRRILDFVTQRPMYNTLRIKEIAKGADLSEKQASLSLGCMINRRDQVFTGFKDHDLAVFAAHKPLRNGWFNQALDELTYDIDDLSCAIDDLGNSRLAEKVFGNYNKAPWHYVPLIKFNEIPIYAHAQLNFLKNF